MLHLARLYSLTVLAGLFLPAYTVAISEVEQQQLARQSFIAQIPLDKLPEPLKNKLHFVIQRGQLFERGKAEAFPCNPEVYRWLLESPDASLYAWKKLGATKVSITRLDNGTFVGSDGAGGELRWNLVATGPTTRIWYAEGSGRIGPLLPTMTIRAIVTLHFQDVKGTDGRKGIKHRVEVMAHHDSTTLINKLTSMSAETAGKKTVQQLEVFFSGMAWYVSEHSAWSRLTFSHWASTPENKTRLKCLVNHLDQADAVIESGPPDSR